LLCLLLGSFTLSACQIGHNSESDDSSNNNGDTDPSTPNNDIDVDIGEEANKILEEQGGLYQFTLTSFDLNNTDDNVRDDTVALYFNSYLPADTNTPPDEDDKTAQTDNDLYYEERLWSESDPGNLQWKVDRFPFEGQHSPYNKTRPYRVIVGDTLSLALNVQNKPIYEAIDDELVERHLGATFVFDLNGFGDIKKHYELHNDNFDKYTSLESSSGGRSFNLLEHASVWGDNNAFNEGAELFTGIRKVNNDIIVVESTLNNDNYDFTQVGFDSGTTDINTLPDNYSNGIQSPIAFHFTNNYIEAYSLYVSFDSGSQTAYLHSDASSDAIASTSYSIENNLYIEIDIQQLSATANNANPSASLLDLQQSLNLSSDYNIAITGPFLSDNEDLQVGDANAKYYFAKRYLQSESETNIDLQQPVFFFNGQAQSDIEAQFLTWRQEQYDNDDYYD